MKVYEVIKRSGDTSSFAETSLKLTRVIQEVGENERMKGFGHSTYMKLIYKACGLNYKKPKSGSFRNTLSAEDLEKVINIEDEIITMLLLDMNYDDIKPKLLERL